jgi:two-component system heavy metal sensor histidine kinase CusS
MSLYALSTIAILLSIGLFLYPTYIQVLQYDDIPSSLATLCYQKIIIALLVSSISAILLGYFVARNGLNRLYKFSYLMENITADSLNDRIDLNDWPKELQVLGNKFNGMLDRLHLSFLQLSQFSSDIAHELRGPLHNLRGMTELALSSEKSKEDYQRILESNLDEYVHLSKLIESLLFLAHVDHGQIKLNKISLHARNEIKKITEYFQAIADEKNIQIRYEGDAIIQVDQTLFKRIINNLLSNALRYTPNQGNVLIKISTNKSHTEISVSDPGIGISKEHISNIFDRFYRADPSRSMLSGGVGLGLAIVKSIVALHKGKISITSKINIGTTVTISLPNN